jgi:hypothetical protein
MADRLLGMDWQKGIIVNGILPLSIACIAQWIGGIKLRRKFQIEHRPVSEKILRLPGYSLRTLDEIETEIPDVRKEAEGLFGELLKS